MSTTGANTVSINAPVTNRKNAISEIIIVHSPAIDATKTDFC